MNLWKMPVYVFGLIVVLLAISLFDIPTGKNTVTGIGKKKYDFFGDFLTGNKDKGQTLLIGHISN